MTEAAVGETTKEDATAFDQAMINVPSRILSSNDQNDVAEEVPGEMSEWEKRKALAGSAKFSRIGWKRLTVVLIVEAVALGALSLPSSFAALGMVAGTFCSVLFGLIAIYAGHNVGAVKVKYPDVENYADAARLMFGRFGYEFVSGIFLLELIFISGTHCLTGTMAFLDITSSSACSLIFGVVSALILFTASLPPSFAEMAILGYIDCASIIGAIGVTMIATGIQSTEAPGGLGAVNWSAWPKDGVTTQEIFIAIVNIILAYTFTLCQFSFMGEMHTPTDYSKAVWATGMIEIIIYTLTGAVIYAFVGIDVKSPALLSGGKTISKVAFGVALPVIFISGAVITQVAAQLVHRRIYDGRIERYVNTTKGWITWIITVFVIVVIGWVIAEAIPFFGDLVALISSLFNSGFALYLPALMWFMLLKDGEWSRRENIIKGLLNGLMFLAGMGVLVGGTWATIMSIIDNYRAGSVGGSFQC